jgi:hypothetical protein
MGERRKTGEPPRGPLVEGAARLESLVRSLKSNQLARTRAKVGPQPPVSEAFVLSPDEAWAKKYMTHCIGPVCFPATGADVPAFAKFPAKPASLATTHGFQAPAKAAGVNSRNPQQTAIQAVSEPIGLAIGKPAVPRSWLGRLLRGR